MVKSAPLRNGQRLFRFYFCCFFLYNRFARSETASTVKQQGVVRHFEGTLRATQTIQRLIHLLLLLLSFQRANGNEWRRSNEPGRFARAKTKSHCRRATASATTSRSSAIPRAEIVSAWTSPVSKWPAPAPVPSSWSTAPVSNCSLFFVSFIRLWRLSRRFSVWFLLIIEKSSTLSTGNEFT